MNELSLLLDIEKQPPNKLDFLKFDCFMSNNGYDDAQQTT